MKRLVVYDLKPNLHPPPLFTHSNVSSEQTPGDARYQPWILVPSVPAAWRWRVPITCSLHSLMGTNFIFKDQERDSGTYCPPTISQIKLRYRQLKKKKVAGGEEGVKTWYIPKELHKQPEFHYRTRRWSNCHAWQQRLLRSCSHQFYIWQGWRTWLLTPQCPNQQNTEITVIQRRLTQVNKVRLHKRYVKRKNSVLLWPPIMLELSFPRTIWAHFM